MTNDPQGTAPDADANPAPGPFAARLKAQYGAGVDPEVSLDIPSGEASAPATGELVRRLAEQAPKHSRYTLEGEVARGGMGAILKIWDADLRRHLAMKVILGRADSPGKGGTPQVEPSQLARFLEEAQVTGQLDHPGIVPVHELGLDSAGRVYFTMKLVKGRDLKTIFELVFAGQEGWNETRALGVILKACEAMAYAHTKGVIHRDLKPANVMVGNFGEVFVMDWGLARVLGRKDSHDIRIAPELMAGLSSVKSDRRDEREELSDSPVVTMDGDVVGTPAYMSPEQARGEIEKLSPRSDVYAIGAMLYHLLARQVPYVPRGTRISNRTVLGLVLNGPPTALSTLRQDVPAELGAIVEKAMAREASRRYPDTLALAEDLRAFLEHRVVGAYETGAWAETRKWVERNKPLAASLAAALVLLMAGLTVSLVFKARADENAELASRRADETAEQARIAEANAARATQKANDVLSLSAIQDLKDLEERADALWPAHPENVPKYETWLADARMLIEGQPDRAKGVKAKASLAQHEAKLTEIRQQAKPLSPEQSEADRRASPSYAEWEKARSELEQAPPDSVSSLTARVADLQRNVDERRTYEFEDGEARWWHAQLSTLVSDLKALTDENSGGLFSSGTSEKHGWSIAKRAEFAQTIEERSLSGVEAKRRWDEAIAAIAKSPQYSGLSLTPQIGLLPIGEDPGSHLWEFAHIQTGEPAQRGADGKLILKEEMGLIFVLIPGGTFWMGAQKTDESGRNYDPQALPKESPVHEVSLSPYFLSKYEMTQGQWRICAGRNPSIAGAYAGSVGYQSNLLHPVEQVTWTQCMAVLSRLGLTLPSEAQWENGCRGGTGTVWWTGSERESLRGLVNIADQTAKKAGVGWLESNDWPDLEDGWAFHAPVGSFPANPYGLHEVTGNLIEWCLDGHDGGSYGRSPEVDPVAPWYGAAFRVVRAGGYYNTAGDSRSAKRIGGTADSKLNVLGLRPARAAHVPASPLHPR